jgi:hypothetical protein
MRREIELGSRQISPDGGWPQLPRPQFLNFDARRSINCPHKFMIGNFAEGEDIKSIPF